MTNHQTLDCGGCGGSRRLLPTRRSLLRVGGLSLFGLPLSGILQAKEQSPPGRARAKAIIFLHQFGGPSQTDTVDMKPRAPEAIRGEFKPVPTRAPGILVCERLPRLAQVADKFALVRSVFHDKKNHNSATYYSLTGHAPPLDDIRLRDTNELFPAYGSVVDLLAPAKAGVPTFVSYPHVLRDGSLTPGQHASFLGKTHDPFFIGQDPNSADFRLPELSLPSMTAMANSFSCQPAPSGWAIISATANRAGRASRKRCRTPCFSMPMTESCGPVMPTSVV